MAKHDQIIQVFQAAGLAAVFREDTPGTLRVTLPSGGLWVSVTTRNGGRGYWKNGKRQVIPNTMGRGWRKRLVDWVVERKNYLGAS